MTTQGTETRQGQDLQGLGAKHDGPFGVADAPQPTDNAETIMTDVQQAVPVAQQDREAAAREREQQYSRLGHNPLTLETPTEMRRGERDWDMLVQKHAAARLASLPCKSGEGAEAGREAVARIIRGHMPSHWCDEDALRTEAFSTALADAIVDAFAGTALTPDATQTREAELVAALTKSLSSSAIKVLVSDRFKAEGWEPPLSNSPLIVELVESGLFRLTDARCGFEKIKDSWIKPTAAGLLARAALNARGGA